MKPPLVSNVYRRYRKSTLNLFWFFKNAAKRQSKFSPNTHLVRSLSLEGKALFGVGTSFSEGGLYYAAEGSLSLVYQRGAWSFRVGGGNHVSASVGMLKRQGLFLSLGTAYTYTL